MAKKVSKTLHYRVVNFENHTQKVHTLEKYITALFAELEFISDRKITIGQHNYDCLYYAKNSNNGLFLHLAVSVEGESATVIPKRTRVQGKVDLQAAFAPDGTEFSNGDLHALIYKNHIVLCCSSLHEGVLKRYLDSMFQENNVELPQFTISPVVSVEVIKSLSSGVKKIGLNCSTQKAFFHSYRNNNNNKFNSIINLISTYFSNEDETLLNSLHNQDVNIDIMISAKGRTAIDDTRLEDLKNISHNIIDDEEYRDGNPFYILTNSGTVITEDGIQIKTKVRMEKYAKTVVREEAQKALQDFLQTLKDDGIVR